MKGRVGLLLNRSVSQNRFISVTCNRPFAWRKKWERNWDEITTCSKQCNNERKLIRNRDQSKSMEDEGEPFFEVDGLSSVVGNESNRDTRLARKVEKKRKKKEKRDRLRGNEVDGAPLSPGGQKQCDTCEKNVDLLVRCTIDESRVWKMVCGKCWKTVSGGVTDGDVDHPYYRYGGLWKNRRRKG